MRSVTVECLSMRRAVGEYVMNSHEGRMFPRNQEIIGSRKGRVRSIERLGGVLKYSHREAA